MATAEPSTIGRYRVLSTLGEGAMGKVFLAQDPILKRKVAIKVMKERSEADESILIRFHREAETSSQLNHPNVITIYDVGEDPLVGPFLTMEYVEGSSLATLVRTHGLTRDTAFEILTHVMLGLMAAGAEGIVHRDVKPENILVGLDGRVKLMDFGIARGEGTRLTATGMVVGTPSYTAPELIQGGESSQETDLYSFAVTAYEVFTGGRLPFRGDNLMSTLYRIVHDSPDIPPDLDPRLGVVFHKALAKNPTGRFPTLPVFMNALADALGVPHPEIPKGLRAAVDLAAAVSGKRPSQDDMPTQAVALGQSPGAILPFGETHGSLVPPPSDLLHQAGRPSAGASVQAAHLGSYEGRTTPVPAKHPSVSRSDVSPLRWILFSAVLGLAGYLGWQQYLNQATRTLSVRTDPPEVDVLVDGEKVGQTNASGDFSGPVGVRTKVVRLSRTNFISAEQLLGSGDQSLGLVTLTLFDNYIKVYSSPRGAEVFLDEVKQFGTTPMELELLPGEHGLRLQLKGYRPWQSRVSRTTPPPVPIRLEPNG